MSSFSIEPCFTCAPIEQWADYLAYHLSPGFPQKTDDPLFLQQLGVVQAEHLRRTVAACAAAQSGIISDELKQLDVSRRHDFGILGQTIQQTGAALSSQLDNGFAAMNYSLTSLAEKNDIANGFLRNIDCGIERLSVAMDGINRAGNIIATGMRGVNNRLDSIKAHAIALNENVKALGQLIDHHASHISTFLNSIEAILTTISIEQRVPEVVREGRFHVEEALKYLRMGVERNNNNYYVDALDELKTASMLNAKDHNLWYYLGYLHLYSPLHLDLTKALEAFEKFFYYAPDNALQWDEACRHLATAQYLLQQPTDSLISINRIRQHTPKSHLLKAKYLSCSKSDSERSKAIEPLKEILQKWPHSMMMVLEDNDLMRNLYVLDFIDDARNEKISEATKLLASMHQRISALYQQRANELQRLTSDGMKVGFTPNLSSLHEIDPLITELHEFVKKNTLMDALAAIDLYYDALKTFEALCHKLDKEVENNETDIKSLHKKQKALRRKIMLAKDKIEKHINDIDFYVKTRASELTDYEFLANTFMEVFKHQPYAECAVWTNANCDWEKETWDFYSTRLQDAYNKGSYALSAIKDQITNLKRLFVEAQQLKAEADKTYYSFDVQDSTFDISPVDNICKQLSNITSKLQSTYFYLSDDLGTICRESKQLGFGYAYPGWGLFFLEHIRWNNVRRRILKKNRPLVEACRAANAKLLDYKNRQTECAFYWFDNFN